MKIKIIKIGKITLLCVFLVVDKNFSKPFKTKI
jgi:hypothetical protein